MRKAFDDSSFAEKITSAHILVNAHKTGKRALEFFRLAPVLSSGMRVVSDRSNLQDEKMLEGLVTFRSKKDMSTVIDSFMEEVRNERLVRRIGDVISTQTQIHFHQETLLNDLLWKLSSVNNTGQ